MRCTILNCIICWPISLILSWWISTNLNTCVTILICINSIKYIVTTTYVNTIFTIRWISNIYILNIPIITTKCNTFSCSSFKIKNNFISVFNRTSFYCNCSCVLSLFCIVFKVRCSQASLYIIPRARFSVNTFFQIFFRFCHKTRVLAYPFKICYNKAYFQARRVRRIFFQ